MGIPTFGLSDLNKFEIKARDAIALALILDWNVRWMNAKRTSAALRHGSKQILIPSTNVNANRAKSWINQIVTHSDTQRLREVKFGDIEILRAEPNVARIVAVTGMRPIDLVRETSEEEPVKAEQQHLTQTVAEVISESIAAGERERQEGVPFTDLDDVAPVEVGRAPYLVNRSGHPNKDGSIATYESKAIEVITYSDGSEKYACRFCGVVYDRPRSVSTHSGAAHKGMATPDFLLNKREEPTVTEPVTPPTPATFSSLLRGVPLLTHHLRAAIAHSDQARDVAVEIIGLDFETRARLAHVILMGKDSETMRAAAEERIAEVERERDAAREERDKAIRWKEQFQNLLTEP